MRHLAGNHVDQQLGNYRLRSLIGRGGFAEVYLGEHIYLVTPAAIKVIASRLAHEDQESFLHEARIIARLQHPHILPVLEFGLEAGLPFLVMEYAPGGSLRNRHPTGSRLTPAAILPYARQVAAALQFSHEQHILHLDIKPENMLLGAGGDVLLSDFGLALGTQSSRTQNMESIAGTVAYMAPELIQGKPTPASDQYALGIVFYEWLSGHCPFRGTFNEIASQQVLAPPPLITSPAVSSEVEAVIFKALAKAPAERFASVQAFVTAFEQATLEVEETFKAPPGWIPPSAYAQLSTVSKLETEPTVRERTTARTTNEAVPTLVPVAHDERTRRRERPLQTRVIALVVLALLVIASGLAWFALHSPTPSVNGTPTRVQVTAQDANPASAWQNIYVQETHAPPTFADTLANDTHQWQSITDATHRCFFQKGAYHISVSGPYTLGSCENKSIDNQRNLVYQVQMTIVQGDEGGLIFQLVDPTATKPAHDYYFTINRNGSYTLWKFATTFTTLLHRSTPIIHTGLNQANLLTVIAQGSQIALYLNTRYVASVVDPSFTAGRIGLSAEGLSNTTTVTFRNLTLWRL